jgi:hypothetical protein
MLQHLELLGSFSTSQVTSAQGQARKTVEYSSDHCAEAGAQDSGQTNRTTNETKNI